MKRRFCKTIFYTLSMLICLASSSYAQNLRAAEREAEWQSFKVPSALFSRLLTTRKWCLFVPDDFEPFVFERAAKRLAENPGIVSILRNHTSGRLLLADVGARPVLARIGFARSGQPRGLPLL